MIFVNINTSNNIFYSELKGDTYKINHIYMGHRKKDREDSIHNVYIQKFEFEIVTNENDSHFFSFDVETYEKKKPNVWDYDTSKITPLHTFIILAGEQSIFLEDKKTNLQNLEKFLNKHLYSFDDLLKKYKEIEKLKKSIDKDFN